jgi:alkaline phosphatase D
MISFDGYRWDYPTKAKTPVLDSISAVGVRAKSLIPSFPSKTFPNHYTLATGLYPGNHGIVNNSFRDTSLKIDYSISNKAAVENGAFYGGEPIWNTAEKQGVKAGCFFWVGSEAPIQGMHASHWLKYSSKIGWESRVDSVIAWLSLPEAQRPHLALWYVSEPDGIGHKFGPFSDRATATVEELDALLGYFFAKLRTLPYADSVNVIFTTDHGMGATSSERYVNLSRFVKRSDFEYEEVGNPLALFQPKKGKLEKVYKALRKVPHVSLWKKGELPENMHYNTNPRITDLVLLADSAWSIGWGLPRPGYDGGAHGYLQTNTDMHGVFCAVGPAFRKGIAVDSFENVEVYNIVCKILGLKPAPNDGKLENVLNFLQKP